MTKSPSSGSPKGHRADQDLVRAARDVLGLQELRSGQLEAMSHTMSGRDVLAVMPTGHGKSALYQVPAALLPGVTVVVSPLIALQRDQVTALADAPGAPPADALNSTQRSAETEQMWQAVRRSAHHILLLGPEQLAREEVIERLQVLDIAQVVVDEAHCVATWGHDFRPDYLRVGAAVEALGHPPVLALTATASSLTREEIVARLRMRDPAVVVRGFDRPNLRLDVRRHVDDHDRRASVVQTVAELEGPGLLYVATRRDTRSYADLLADRGLTATAYHGGLRAAERREAHARFADGTAEVVVATSAFGMGIDKADVRFVVHAATPDSPDAYYQEIGRAGRDGEPAHAILFYRPEDFALHRFHAGGNPDDVLLRTIFRTVREADGGVPLRELRQRSGGSPRRVTAAVNLLERAGAVRVRSRQSIVRGEDLATERAVQLGLDAAQARSRIEASRTEMMRGYAETVGCRREFLLGYLGEQYEPPCGVCDRCEQGIEQPAAAAADVEFPVNATVDHCEWERGVVLRVEEDRVTVVFEREGYRTLSLAAVGARDLLRRVDEPTS